MDLVLRNGLCGIGYLMRRMDKTDKKRPVLNTVWREARELIWRYRYRLALGMVLMLISRAAGLVLPSYDYALKLSHIFNLLDARGAISVTERASYITRIRTIARKIALAYIEKREALGFPLLARAAEAPKLVRRKRA